MKLLIQRVLSAGVSVSGEVIADIKTGMLVLVGVERHDTVAHCARAAEKLTKYRLFSDDNGHMNLSARDISGEILLVSQFTLAAETKKGLRPSFSSAMPPGEALELFNQFVELVKESGLSVKSGQFGADMQVSLVNDGPVTFLLEI